MLIKVYLVLLLLYVSSASALRCTNSTGTECCGLVVGIFPSAFSTNDYFALYRGFFAEENITVCYSNVSQSVTLFNNLLAGAYDLVAANVDNTIWRVLNYSWPLSVLGGTDGNRGFYLAGNTNTLGGYNSVSSLANKTLLVDSLDSGFVVGLWKILNDYNILHNVTYTSLGTNRLPSIISGVYNGQTQYATMVSGTSPYLLPYPVVPLAQLTEHLCPTQGAAYSALTNYSTNATNQADIKKFFRALLRSYQWQLDPNNINDVLGYLAAANSVSNPNITQLIFDDVYKNFAAGLNANLNVRKLGMKNLVNTRIFLGLSQYPAVSVDDFVADTPGGLVDLTVLKEAQAELGLANTYDTDAGTLGCPTGNAGVIVSIPPQITCTAHYKIPITWSSGFVASLNIKVSDPALLKVNGAPGWTVSFSAIGSGSTPPFHINTIWNAGSVAQTTHGNVTTYTLTNPSYATQSPKDIGWTATTNLTAAHDNICKISINGFACAVSTPDTASVTC